MIYIIILLAILYCAYKYDIKGYMGRADHVYWVFCIFFILFVGLRYRIGGDSINYEHNWAEYPDFWNFNWMDDINSFKKTHPRLSRYQPLWMVYVMLVQSISKSFVFFQLTTAMIINIAVFRTIKKYSQYPFITLFIFTSTSTFFDFEFETLREATAVGAFLLIAFDGYVERRWTRYYIGTIVAYLIHPSALAMFALPFIRDLKLSLKTVSIFIVAVPIVLSISGRLFLGNLVSSLFNSGNYTTDYLMSAIGRNYNYNYYLNAVFHPLAMFALVAIYYKRIKDSEFMPLVLASLLFMNFSLLYITGTRLASYIIIPTYICLTPILKHLAEKYRTVWVIPIIMTIYFIPNIWAFQRSDINRARYFPYQTVICPNRTADQKKLDQQIGFN